MWDSHLDSAREAGVDPEAVAEVGRLDQREQALVSLVEELCRGGEVSAGTFEAVHALLGTPAMMELVLTVGYYTMLSYAMKAFEAC